ncbi:MAG: hypothetical protein HY746_04005 [Elusimicrobia bacterium]|nr:hypothetical protein [Elusimicrobiota bacterium]
MNHLKTYIFLLSFFTASIAHTAITDDTANLIIPTGEAYTLDGTHSYSDFIQIDGTLYITGYNGTGTTGMLELISSSITVSSTGKIIADGRGYPSGSGPGKGNDGYRGGGGSYGGQGGGSDLPTYDSIINPIDLGSGGGYEINSSSYPGGAGGGLIRLNVTGDLTIDGLISANGLVGNNYHGGSGSGGSINITTGRLCGSGAIKSDGGYGYNYNSGGGGGRITITTPHNLFTGAITTYGGDSSYAYSGGAGTVFVNGIVTIDNNGITGNTGVYGAGYNVSDISQFIIRSGAIVDFSTSAIIGGALEITAATVAVNDTLTIGMLSVNIGGVISPKAHKIDLTIKGDMILQPGGMITADGRGYPPGEGPGKGPDGISGGGGSHGGAGGGGGPTYGSIINPMDFGSGGGARIDQNENKIYPGGAGGGLIRLNVTGDLTVDGIIIANGVVGDNYEGGAGSGGSINIAGGALNGSGAIRANGNYGYAYNGGGGGGRIAVYYSQKMFTGSISAGGGTSAWGLAGDHGSIVDNGAIISGGALGPGESITAPSQTLGNQRSLTETIRAENVSFDNLTASGTFSGTVDFTQIVFVKINSGAYAGKGFTRGLLNATLEGKAYSGSFEGIIFVESSTISLKGVVSGDLHGSLELELTESAPGNGVYNKVNGLINCNRIGESVLAKLYVSGDASYSQTQDYPVTVLQLTQTAAQGNMTGDYAGPFNAIFTSLTINDAANPYNGEGFSIASYSTNKGEAQGWTYAKRLESGIMNINGLLDYPLYALMQGVFNSGTVPPRLLLDTEKLDNSLLALKVKIFHPYGVSPGGTYSFGIEVVNQGTTTFQNMSVALVAPPHMSFASASSTYTFHSSVYWTNDAYDPIPCIRWDFPQIVPGQVINLSYELKARIGVMSNGEIMKGQVYILPTQDALDFLPGYDYEGPMDDDVIEDADMPAIGRDIFFGSRY